MYAPFRVLFLVDARNKLTHEILLGMAKYIKTSQNWVIEKDLSNYLSQPPLTINDIKKMRLDWSCNNFDFVDENREVITTSPNSNEIGSEALLIAKEKLSIFLEANDLVLLWGVWADKVTMHEYSTQAWLSSYYSYDGKEIIGESIFKLSKDEDS